MKTLLVFIMTLTLSFSAFAKPSKSGEKPTAQETTSAASLPDATPKQIEAGIEKTKQSIDRSRTDRSLSKYAGNILYSPFDLIIPNKIGVSGNYFHSTDEVWEVEYMRGKIAAPFFVDDIGAISDTRFSIGKRIFSGNSFNFSYGLTYFKFKVHIGSDLLNRATNGNTSNIDLVELESLGFRLGVGNRWALGKNLTVGVDWLEWNQPLILTKDDDAFTKSTNNQEDKDDVKDVIKWASYFPRLNVLKMSLGYSFK